MLALDPKTNSFKTCAFQLPDSPEGVRQGARLSGREKAEAARKLEKSWEQSQGVLENKGHDFLKCRNWGGFCTLTKADRVLKGAIDPHIVQNEAKPPSREAMAPEMTRSRLDGWWATTPNPSSPRRELLF